MANPNAPFGLRPIKRVDGQKFGPLGSYTIASGLAEDIGRGQRVKLTGTGRNVSIAADGEKCVGVFLGVKYTAADGSVTFKPNWVSGTTTKNSEPAEAIVCDDPQVVFAVRASGAFALTNVGQFAGSVVGSVDDNGNSTYALNSADITGTLDDLKIVGVGDDPRNEVGDYAVVQVLLARHEYRDPISAS